MAEENSKESGEKITTKLQLKANDELWNKVINFKMQRGLTNNNKAVEELIRLGLKPIENSKRVFIWSSKQAPQEIVEQIKDFWENLPILEKKQNAPLMILSDNKSGAFYTECHLLAKDYISLSDKDSTIDPDLQKEFRANRQLEPDNIYFLQMVEDAENGRQFSDLVIEYNKSYKEQSPLKILGGQHRTKAIEKALVKNVNAVHGIKVYFGLTKDQRAEIMRISNTNINVSSDLRDRIEEHRLDPPLLRDFSYRTKIMKKPEDFGDKRRYEEEFSPTVRMMRSFIVNYFKGRNYNGNIDEDAYAPYLCISGKGGDKEYLKLFNKFKQKGAFDDEGLIEAGEMFAKLHQAQFKKSDKIKGAAKKEYKIKAFSLSVISSWAFAAGVLYKNKKRLKKLYSLPEKSGDQDPLNALAMKDAKHPTIDPQNYRGLGTRTDDKERGRLLHLFLIYSLSEQEKINDKICKAAIEIFHANLAKISAEESKKKAV